MEVFCHLGCLAEWLRRQIRNLLAHCRVGSNPAAVGNTLFCSDLQCDEHCMLVLSNHNIINKFKSIN